MRIAVFCKIPKTPGAGMHLGASAGQCTSSSQATTLDAVGVGVGAGAGGAGVGAGARGVGVGGTGAGGYTGVREHCAEQRIALAMFKS